MVYGYNYEIRQGRITDTIAASWSNLGLYIFKKMHLLYCTLRLSKNHDGAHRLLLLSFKAENLLVIVEKKGKGKHKDTYHSNISSESEENKN